MSDSGNDPTFLYFAYGSNMLTSRIQASERAPSAVPVATGWLPGRRLSFEKHGADESGKCDIPEAADPDARVHGVVYRVHADHRPALDRVEELGWGYRDEHVAVQTQEGPLPALTYMAIRHMPGLAPFDWYRDLTLAGALEHALPSSYVEAIRQTPTRVDPDYRRREHHRRLVRHIFATFGH